MKKVLTVLVLGLGLMSCNEVTNQPTKIDYLSPITKLSIVTKDGHDYIVVEKGSSGGAGICHSESCACK